MRTWIVGTLALVATLPLAGCGDKAGDQGSTNAVAAASPSASSATLATALADAPGLSTVSGALKSSGLASVFDGNAPYTLLAPDDDAFGALGPAGAALRTPENAAAMATVLRAHVLPGVITTADIRAALKTRQGKPVKMTTMAGGDVSFASEGDAITVTAEDGSRAKLSGPETTATNGVAIPVDAVLKKVPAGA